MFFLKDIANKSLIHIDTQNNVISLYVPCIVSLTGKTEKTNLYFNFFCYKKAIIFISSK